MKRLILVPAVGLLCALSLTGCASGEDVHLFPTPTARPVPMTKPSGSLAPSQEQLYRQSDADDNQLTHWVFTQRLPNGSTAVCVAARDNYTNSVGIDCPVINKG